MKAPKSLPATFRVGTRYYWRATVPLLHGWPCYKLRVDDVGLTLQPARFLPFPFRLDVSWSEIARVERKTQGFRLIFNDGRRNVAVGKLRPKQMLATIATCPVLFDSETVHPTTWSEI